MHKNIVIATAATLSIFSSTAAFAGLTFKMVTTSSGNTSEAEIWVDGNSMKSSIPAGQANPMMPAGSYMLVNEQGMFLVNPTARTYARFDLSVMENAMQAMNQSGMASSIEFKDIVVEKTIDEPGESIEGYATRHYQYKSSWKMVMAGSPVATEATSVEDYWVTDAIALPTAGAGMTLDRSGLPSSVQEFADAQGIKDIEGFPLRTVTAQTMKMNMGGLGGALGQRMMNRAMGGAGAGDMLTTIEAKDIQQVDIPAETFEIPAGFSETQLFQTGPALPDLNSLPDGANQPGAQPPDVPNLDNLPTN